jgi:hypothetical protein
MMGHEVGPEELGRQDTAGFVYPPHQAAEDQGYEDKLHIKESDQAYAHIRSVIGGSIASLSFEDAQTEDILPPRRGGGIRGPVTGFSGPSRMRLLRKVASINRHTFWAMRWMAYFITLTYPANYPEDPKVWKENRKAFDKRLKRKYGDSAGIWRLEIQDRGAPHFHLLLFAPPSIGSLEDLRSFVRVAWWEVCGKVGEGHLQAGTSVEPLYSWRRVSRVGRYMAKREEFPEGLETGRIWGVWNEHLLPVQWETVKVSREDAFTIRRIFRRLARKKGTGTLRTLTVFVQHENVIRLLEYLGYRDE